ncbi:peptidoglycan DD-metalloendopeptidase family protein [Stappia sp. GBMRC 2046]|uniref:Peptidoglycan DD-metalloendopeptidase family protein n=1 Tax=Stappia sediminis TaxID=2692190 RepID=A0A7X3LT24_9HYPH|nr:peptidoglycan DD-metalloendopeptidase family protein [Stappia sediminis]MXN64571.1 peptidoglycan DD-metalloendopeptidase family protein [Stappia sediminis]
MITHFTRRQAHYLSRTAIVVVIAAMAAGCSSHVDRFEGPIYTGSTGNQKKILNQGFEQPSFDDIAAGPTASTVKRNKVESADLPPANGYSPPSTTGSISKSSRLSPTLKPIPTSGGQSTLQAQAQAESGAQAPRTSRGWSTAGGTHVTVTSGDTLYSMSRRYGVPQKVLADVNGLDSAASLQAGQKIVIPTYSASPGRSATNSAPVRLPPANGEPSVTGTVPKSAARLNTTLPRPEPKPESVRVASVPATTVTDASVGTPSRKPEDTAAGAGRPTAKVGRAEKAAGEPSRVVTTERVGSKKEEKPEKVEVAALASNAADPNEGRFRWPVRGRIISEFGSKPGGTRNDGINLAVPEGTEVKAADDGVVIYSGNELKGYGNLILVRHSEGWVSAYAHNSKLSVSRGDSVRRGDTIGYAGATGSVSQPQVHFELRKGNKPVDPMRYMSRG